MSNAHGNIKPNTHTHTSIHLYMKASICTHAYIKPTQHLLTVKQMCACAHTNKQIRCALKFKMTLLI